MKRNKHESQAPTVVCHWETKTETSKPVALFELWSWKTPLASYQMPSWQFWLLYHHPQSDASCKLGQDLEAFKGLMVFCSAQLPAYYDADNEIVLSCIASLYGVNAMETHWSPSLWTLMISTDCKCVMSLFSESLCILSTTSDGIEQAYQYSYMYRASKGIAKTDALSRLLLLYAPATMRMPLRPCFLLKTVTWA